MSTLLCLLPCPNSACLRNVGLFLIRYLQIAKNVWGKSRKKHLSSSVFRTYVELSRSTSAPTTEVWAGPLEAFFSFQRVWESPGEYCAPQRLGPEQGQCEHCWLFITWSFVHFLSQEELNTSVVRYLYTMLKMYYCDWCDKKLNSQ